MSAGEAISPAEQAFTDDLRALAKLIRDCDVEEHGWAECVLPPLIICLFCGTRLEIEVRK